MVDRLLERLGSGVEGAEEALDVAVAAAEPPQQRHQRARVRALHGPETAEAAAVVGGAERVAAGLRDRAETRRAMRHHHANDAAPLALGANARGRDTGPAAVQERRHDLEQLALVDRAAA